MYKSARDAAGALVLYLADATLSPIYPRDDLFTFEVRAITCMCVHVYACVCVYMCMHVRVYVCWC